MDSDFQQQQYQHHFQDFPRQLHHQKQGINGLTRFRSAPSSYFASFLDATNSVDSTVTSNNGGGGGGGGGSSGGQKRDFSNARPLSPESENIVANFVSSMSGENTNTPSQKLCNIPENTPVQPQPHYMVEVKQETETLQQQHQQQQQQQHQQLQQQQQQLLARQGSSSKPPLARQGSSSKGSSFLAAVNSIGMDSVPSKPPLARQGSSGIDSSFLAAANAVPSSMGMNSMQPQMKVSRGINQNTNSISSGLTRHSSTPASFFSDILNMDNGFGMVKGMGNYGSGNSQLNFPLGQAPSTSGLMSQNSDVEAKGFTNSSHNNNNNDSNYITGYPMSSWDDSIMSENFSSLDRGDEDDDRKIFSELNASENQSGEGRNRPLLAHHLSLPNASALEKLLQDTVPCKIRAKRGCATHPRSIAERVRRTRISERMRKLQDLVPNMDKQTNTSDMLDLAVDYIKDLQKQVKTLADTRARCSCS